MKSSHGDIGSEHHTLVLARINQVHIIPGEIFQPYGAKLFAWEGNILCQLSKLLDEDTASHELKQISKEPN